MAWGSQATRRDRRTRKSSGTSSWAEAAARGPLERPFWTGSSLVVWETICRLMLTYRIDMDIEGGSQTGYTAFLTALRTLMNGGNKKCVFMNLKWVRTAIDGVIDTISPQVRMF